VLADFADLRQVERMAAEVIDRVDRLDVLVNNAGIGFGALGAGRELSRDGYVGSRNPPPDPAHQESAGSLHPAPEIIWKLAW
jgi:NAD(P)-dependent dehydrogenase (short-subunit alcohol dehydrogenase family)